MSRRASELSVLSTLGHREILLTGSTGFLGKVVAGLLLHRVPQVSRLFVLVRAGSDEEAYKRFQDEVLCSPVFQSFEKDWINEKVEVLCGDVAAPLLGLRDDIVKRLKPKLDLIIHCAGLTDFDPPLPEAIAINVSGAVEAARLAATCQHAKLVHISTCYVAGARDGSVPESVTTPFTPNEELQSTFDAKKEVERVLHLVEELRRQARSPHELRKQLREVGMDIAQTWGWPNTYTYSKSLGEQLLLSFREKISLTILRPAVIETAVEFPFSGWVEGETTTSAPLVYLYFKGLRYQPAQEHSVLDVVPVDYVARAILLVSSALLRGQAEDVYQIACHEDNRFNTARLLDLCNLAQRRVLEYQHAPQWMKLATRAVDTIHVSRPHWERFGLPAFHRATSQVLRWTQSPEAQGLTFLKTHLKKVQGPLKSLRAQLNITEKIVRALAPFTHDHVYAFVTKNVQSLSARLANEERKFFDFPMKTLSIRDYWINVHVPGLIKWVFPKLDARLKKPAPEEKQNEKGTETKNLLALEIQALLKPESMKREGINSNRSLRTLPTPAPVSRALTKAVRRALTSVQDDLYNRFEISVTGRNLVPRGQPLIVVSNHCSHLDMGLVKYALGNRAGVLHVFAASDYFFSTPLRRAFFGNLTNLVPLERASSLSELLARADKIFKRGDSLLIFPEGTRSRNGELQKFRAGAAALALTHGIDVLPVSLGGTHQAFPRGALIPDWDVPLSVRIGNVITAKSLVNATKRMERTEAQQAVTQMIQKAVLDLATCGKKPAVKAAATHAHEEKRAHE